jgi:hypothetical protein
MAVADAFSHFFSKIQWNMPWYRTRSGAINQTTQTNSETDGMERISPYIHAIKSILETRTICSLEADHWSRRFDRILVALLVM